MPELAEVEIVRRNLERWWESRAASEVRIVDDRILEKTDAETLGDALRTALRRADRRGKYLLCRMEDETTVVFHFRMTGKIICSDDPEPDYARLAWRIDGVGWLVFKDQRMLGMARVLGEREFDEYEPLRRMGPEPEDAMVEHFNEACSDRRIVKTALLDQSIVAGVGNIAVSELLWRLKWPPGVKCGDLDDEDWKRLIDEMPRYFGDIIERSKGDEVLYIEEADVENIFDVYDRDGEKCRRCGGRIRKEKIGGRASYFCEDCQR